MIRSRSSLDLSRLVRSWRMRTFVIVTTTLIAGKEPSTYVSLMLPALTEPYRPIRFDCTNCGLSWFTPANGCPNCPEGAISIADPVIWKVDRATDTNILISAQLRDADRLRRIIGFYPDMKMVIDVAADPDNKYTWRAPQKVLDLLGIEYVLVADVWDTNDDLPDRAFDEVSRAILRSTQNEVDVLVHCSAGLKRAPHLVYGHFLSLTFPPVVAWEMVKQARSMTSPYLPYIESAHRWANVPL